MRVSASKCIMDTAFLISRIPFACRLESPRRESRQRHLLVRFAAGLSILHFGKARSKAGSKWNAFSSESLALRNTKIRSGRDVGEDFFSFYTVSSDSTTFTEALAKAAALLFKKHKFLFLTYSLPPSSSLRKLRDSGWSNGWSSSNKRIQRTVLPDAGDNLFRKKIIYSRRGLRPSRVN